MGSHWQWYSQAVTGSAAHGQSPVVHRQSLVVVYTVTGSGVYGQSLVVVYMAVSSVLLICLLTGKMLLFD